MSDGSRFKGLEIELHRYSGSRVLRVVHPDVQLIDPHTHSRAYIGIYALGGYRELYDGGEAEMSSPSVVLHPAGRPHADVIGDRGLETLTIEFDPAWLRRFGFEAMLDRSRLWTGGPAALASRRLARIAAHPSATEAAIGRATASFLYRSLAVEAPARPGWLGRVERELESARPRSTRDIARDLDLNPAWLAHAYRVAVGEGMQDTARRRRVERASALLRKTDRALADIAAAAGFCDQAHMNRCFRQVLGRTPLAVRGERSV